MSTFLNPEHRCHITKSERDLVQERIEEVLRTPPSRYKINVCKTPRVADALYPNSDMDKEFQDIRWGNFGPVKAG